MEFKINLTCYDGFKWSENEFGFVKGYAVIAGVYYEGIDLLEYLLEQNSESNLLTCLSSVNGCFVAILRLSGELCIISDKLRSIPLFYALVDNTFVIRDKLPISAPINNESDTYSFLLAGYTLGESTMLESFKQTLAGEIISFSDGGVKKKHYYKHIRKAKNKPSKSDHFKKLSKITNSFSSRLALSLVGKTAVVPLSGGYDSRYVLCSLIDAGITDIICYTYGNRESFEVETAKKVSDSLGVTLHVVEYNDKKWGELLDDEAFLNYVNYSFNYSSLPHIQDFIAISELKKKGVFNDNCVFIPGFCGDVLGGSYIPKEVLENCEHILPLDKHENYIYTKQFKNIELNFDSLNVIKDKIASEIEPSNYSLNELISNNEMFLTNNRLSKFIVNSLRVYEFFGFQWRMPLWDDELINYWYSVDNHSRINSQLYNDFLLDVYFEKHNVSFRKKVPAVASPPIIMLRKYFPRKIVNMAREIYRYLHTRLSLGDVNNFNSFSNLLLVNVNAPEKCNNVNGALAYWLLDKVKKGRL